MNEHERWFMCGSYHYCDCIIYTADNGFLPLRRGKRRYEMTVIQTIKEQAYEIIKKKILTSEYPLGARINIGQLSKELGISNSPIREALNLLEQQGLVVSTPNSGINVVTMTRRDYFELTQVILFWVAGSYDYCVEINRIDRLCDEMEAVLAAQKKYFEENNEYEFTYSASWFDRCIIAATGNRRLLTQFDNVFPLFFLGSLYDRLEGHQSMQSGIDQHEKILRAIRSGNRDDVIAALNEHYYKPVWDLRGRPLEAADMEPDR